MNPFQYNPQEQDYRTWLVINPATWLIPILMSVFLLGILIHALLFTSSPYGEYWGGGAAEAEAPVVEAAPAPEAE